MDSAGANSTSSCSFKGQASACCLHDQKTFLQLLHSHVASGTAPVLAAYAQFRVVLLLLLAILLLLSDFILLAEGLTLPHAVELVSMSPTFDTQEEKKR